MKFRYIGFGPEPPETITIYGHAFELNGEPVEVEAPEVAAKLSGNQCFESAVPVKIHYARKPGRPKILR